MGRDNNQGTTWASVLAVLAVTGSISILYLPLLLW
jgi:hypothetical protein